MNNFYRLFLILVLLGSIFAIQADAQIIYRQNFDTVWTTPGTLSPAWSGTTTPADNQWQRNDFTTGWTTGTSGAYTPTGANSSANSARFHSVGSLLGSTGDLITPQLNFSISAGTKYIDFYYINSNGTDSLRVYFSSDNGTSWSSVLLTLGLSTSWVRKTVSLGTSTSTQALVKFSATSDHGTSDIGVDQVLLYASTSPLTGTKAIDPATGDFKSFSEAINILNISGVGAGGVTFNVTSGTTFTENPPVITATGTSSNPIIFQKSGAGANPIIRPTGTALLKEAGIAIEGGDYIAFDGIDITGLGNNEHGFYIYNASGTDGAQFNTIKNSRIVLNRLFTGSLSIFQNVVNVPSNSSGTNSNNKYYNITIDSAHSGIYLLGNATYPDNLCEIGVTDSTKTTFVGSSSSQNIYGYAGPTFGIKAAQQSNCKIFKCEVRNVWSYDYTQPTDGILFDNSGATVTGIGAGNMIYNNKVYNISNSASQSSNVSKVSGIRVNLTNNAGNIMKVYNNMIYSITNSASQYFNPTERSAFGIYLQNSAGAGEIDVYFNNIRMTGNACSNTCFEVGTVTGPMLLVKNNIFANFSTNALNKFYSFVVPSQTLIGNTGSISDYNDLYNGGNQTSGYIGKADTSNLKTLANWQAKVSQDANSKNVDPLYTSATDLHITYLNRTLFRAGQTISGIYNDFDFDLRNNPPCIGADEYIINDTTSKAEEPAVQIPATNIPSVDTNMALSVPVFNFKISDAGPDGKPTKVTNIKIRNSFPANGASWLSVLGGMKINDGTSDIITGAITFNDTNINIPIVSGNLIVNDASSKTITLYVYLKKVQTDNKKLQFTIPQINHGFNSDGNTGSTFLADFGAAVTSNIHTITVTAIQLVMTVPAATYLNTNFSLTINAKDGSGNMDLDAAYPVTLTRLSGTGVLSSVTGLTQSLAAGVYSWTDLRYNTSEIYTIQASGGSLTAVSGNITCYPSSVDSVVLIGEGQVITSLTGANGLFYLINTYGMQKSITVRITSDLTEVGTNALNQWVDTDSVKKTLTIMPNDTAEKVISGSVALGGMIRINGADRVKFDGRYMDNGKHLRFRNRNTANPTIAFLNDAMHDTLTYCIFESGNTSTSYGTVYFGGTTGLNGNDSNTVRFCDVRDRTDSVRTYSNGIFSYGNLTYPKYNSVITIDSCNIYNNSGGAIYLMSASSDWTITNNSFYQTVAKTATNMYGIYVNSPTYGTYTINNNYFGGSEPFCGGTPMVVNFSGSSTFYGVYISCQAAIPSNVTNNTFQNMVITNGSYLTFYPIVHNSGGSCNITGNKIGSSTGNGSIVANNSGVNMSMAGIAVTYTSGFDNIQNNQIGSITLGGTNLTGTFSFYGITASGSAAGFGVNINNNIIGSDSTPNSIQQIVARQSIMFGISAWVTGKPVRVTNNSISNINNLSTIVSHSSTPAKVTGINVASSGIAYISNNRLTELSCSSGDSLSAPGSNVLTGIYMNTTSANDTIMNNTIQGLRANHLTAKTCVYGININGAGSTGIVTQNRIWDLTDSSSHAGSRVYGVFNYLGSNWKYINNQISIPLGMDVQGIHDEFKTGSFLTYYYNSVYLGGSVSAGAVNSYGYKRLNGVTVNFLNNIFYNDRTGGTGFHYAMGNVEDTLTLGWNSAASNFNLFVVPDTSFAFERGPNIGQSFFSWKSATGGDGNSYTGLNSYIPSSNLFTGTSLGNLNIINTNTECWHSYGKGVQIPAVNTDYSGNTRSITIADGPTCIGSNEFNTNSSVNLPPVTAVVPVSNTTTACVFDGRNLMDLTWGTGVLPATVNIKYYSGKIVPDTLTGMVTGKSYWHVRPNIQPESAYNIKINFGAFETGKIPFLSDIILAKLDSVSGVWSSYPRGTTGNGVSIIDTVNQTITVNGITGLGIFTLLDKNTVLNQFSMNLKLLFEGSYFDGGKPGYLVPDTVTVFLIDSALGWVKTDSVGVIIDSLGQGSFVTTKVTLGSNYYIRVKNSKTMETWSATGNNTFSPATGNLTYDFTTAKANAYGGNQVLKNSKWCIFSGDVNQDAFVDGSDVALVDNDAYNGLLGWRNTDLNGDLFIDGSDLSSCDNNAFNGVIINRPPGFPGTLVNNPITVKANKAIEKIKNENDGPEANEFTLSVTDLMQNSSDSLTFRIYLKNTSATRKEFASGQYYFDFNPSILNGGTGILRLLSSDLSVTNQAPRNPTVILSPPQLVFRTNAVPGAGFGKLINAGDSVLVAYASLKTTTGAFSPLNTGMSWTTFMSGNPQRTKIFYYIENLNTEVSQNGIYYNPEDSPLPVEISSFSANVIKRDINLNWTTNREMNNEGFEVQRSLVIDGISKNDFKWEKAGYVPGKGNSLSNQNYSFSQKNQNSGKYSYRLKQIDYNGNFEYFYLKDYVNIGIPVKFDLSQNYPNPFNPVTKINYDLSRDSKVTIKIYDISGREVYTLINESLAAGYYTAEFNASNLSSGVYFYQIIAQGSKDRFVMNKKMMLIK